MANRPDLTADGKVVPFQQDRRIHPESGRTRLRRPRVEPTLTAEPGYIDYQAEWLEKTAYGLRMLSQAVQQARKRRRTDPTVEFDEELLLEQQREMWRRLHRKLNAYRETGFGPMNIEKTGA